MDSIDKQPRNKNMKKNRLQIGWLQQRTATTAISILFAITIGVIGIEVLSAKQKDEYQENFTNTGAKSLKIIALEKEKNQPGATSSLPQSWASDQLSSETNQELQRLQAKKIKELKRQLNEANQKLHDVKANLFTKGDPADRAKLASICQELIEKEKYNDKFQKKISALKTERELRNKKIIRMEQTIDALAAMADSLRESKEKTIFNFQSQIERLSEDIERERKEFEKIEANLNESNAALQDAITAKNSLIKTLEDEVSWQSGLIMEKDQEIKTQSKLFTSSENFLQNEKRNLAEILELAMLKNRIHSKELEKALALGKAQEQNSKLLERQSSTERKSHQKQIDQLNSDLTNLARAYIELQQMSNIYAHSYDHLVAKQSKLAALIQTEQSFAKKLQNELENALAAVDAEQQRGLCFEEELHASSQKIHNMKEELIAKQSLIEKKEQELVTLNYSTASLRDQLNARIQQLTASLEEERNEKQVKEEIQRELAINLELERAKYQELHSKFEDTLTTNHKLAMQINEMQEQIYKDAERMIALEESIIDRQKEIGQLQNQTNNLTQSLNQEKQRSNELLAALTLSLDENEFLVNSNAAMEKTIKAEKMNNHSLMSYSEESQEALERLNREIVEKEKAIDNLKNELNNQTAYSKEMSAKLENLASSNSTSATAANSDQQQTTNMLQYQIAKLKQMLELERNKSVAFDRATLNKSKYTEQLEQKVDEYNSRIAELETTIREQKEQLVDIQNKHEDHSQSFSNRKKEIALNNTGYAGKTDRHSQELKNPSTTYHRVERGENLKTLSTYYYGSPNRWIDIYNANRSKVPDKNRLEVGMELTIPQ